jgi:hypothetical protein
MKRFLKSWTAFAALITSPLILTALLMFGLHWRMFPPFTGYPFPLPILWPA